MMARSHGGHAAILWQQASRPGFMLAGHGHPGYARRQTSNVDRIAVQHGAFRRSVNVRTKGGSMQWTLCSGRKPMSGLMILKIAGFVGLACGLFYVIFLVSGLATGSRAKSLRFPCRSRWGLAVLLSIRSGRNCSLRALRHPSMSTYSPFPGQIRFVPDRFLPTSRRQAYRRRQAPEPTGRLLPSYTSS